MFDFVNDPEFIIRHQQDRALQILRDCTYKQTDRMFFLNDGFNTYYCTLGVLAEAAGINPRHMTPDTDLELKTVEYWGLFGMNKLIESLNDTNHYFAEIANILRKEIDDRWREGIYMSYIETNPWILNRMLIQSAV